MSTQRQVFPRYTVAEYFGLEEASEIKHEYYQGVIVAMVGASHNHNRIAGNVFAALHAALKGTPCEAFTSDLRVRTPGGLYTYPDVAVICGPIDRTEDPLETVTNPCVLVEVLSDSTREYDQKGKMAFYRSLPTLRDYVLIEQTSVKLDHWRLEGEQWILRQHSSQNERLHLSAISFQMLLSEIYERVHFAP
jgi:Uma2 family endonuclease